MMEAASSVKEKAKDVADKAFEKGQGVMHGAKQAASRAWDTVRGSTPAQSYWYHMHPNISCIIL
jgi:hypothetical protein